jgi:hypothetical protein
LPLAQESELSLPSSDPGLNLNNIIDDLMRNPEYLESLNEPTPYDHIQNIPNLHCSSDIVPDLLQFPRSQGAIASDSVGPLEAVAVISGQSTSQVELNFHSLQKNVESSRICSQNLVM